MDESLARLVRERAGFRCEYCLLPQPHVRLRFAIDHVIPRQHGGPTTPGNLAYSCLHCNQHKGPNLASLDRVTSRTKLVRVFDPRRHRWAYHFELDGPVLVGRTPIGRATVALLKMNDADSVRLRAELIDEDLYPPPG